MKNNSRPEHLIIFKTWMNANEEGKTVCIFQAFDMENKLTKKD